jgi:hypothetical protein
MQKDLRQVKPKRLSPKQKKLVKALGSASSVAEAGRIAGYSDRSAAHKALATIELKMPELMDREGLTDEVLVNNYLRPGLESTKREYFANGGVVLETREEPDWATRRGFLDMAFKIKGKYLKVAEVDEKEPHGLYINLGLFQQPEAEKIFEELRAREETKGALVK